MDQKQAQKDLEFIRSVINESRYFVFSNGLYYIAWGINSVICTILTYIAYHLNANQAILWIWMAFLAAGGIISFFITKTDKKTTKMIIGRILGRVWLGISIFLTVFFIAVVISGNIQINMLLAFTSGALGLGYFITSSITKSRWLFVFSLVWWAGCVPVILIDKFYAPAALCALVVICELIPGAVLFVKSMKKNNIAVEE